METTTHYSTLQNTFRILLGGLLVYLLWYWASFVFCAILFFARGLPDWVPLDKGLVVTLSGVRTAFGTFTIISYTLPCTG